MAGDGGETAIIHFDFRGWGDIARGAEIQLKIKNLRQTVEPLK